MDAPIVRGWRRLRAGEVRQEGDRIGFKTNFRVWTPIASFNVGSKVGVDDQTVTIRKVKRV